MPSQSDIPVHGLPVQKHSAEQNPDPSQTHPAAGGDEDGVTLGVGVIVRVGVGVGVLVGHVVLDWNTPFM